MGLLLDSQHLEAGESSCYGYVLLYAQQGLAALSVL